MSRRPNFDDHCEPSDFAGWCAEIREDRRRREERRLTIGMGLLVSVCLGLIGWAAFLAPFARLIP